MRAPSKRQPRAFACFGFERSRPARLKYESEIELANIRHRQLHLQAALVKKKLVTDIGQMEADASDQESFIENAFKTTVKVKEWLNRHDQTRAPAAMVVSRDPQDEQADKDRETPLRYRSSERGEDRTESHHLRSPSPPRDDRYE